VCRATRRNSFVYAFCTPRRTSPNPQRKQYMHGHFRASSSAATQPPNLKTSDSDQPATVCSKKAGCATSHICRAVYAGGSAPEMNAFRCSCRRTGLVSKLFVLRALGFRPTGWGTLTSHRSPLSSIGRCVGPSAGSTIEVRFSGSYYYYSSRTRLSHNILLISIFVPADALYDCNNTK